MYWQASGLKLNTLLVMSVEKQDRNIARTNSPTSTVNQSTLKKGKYLNYPLVKYCIISIMIENLLRSYNTTGRSKFLNKTSPLNCNIYIINPFGSSPIHILIRVPKHVFISLSITVLTDIGQFVHIIVTRSKVEDEH